MKKAHSSVYEMWKNYLLSINEDPEETDKTFDSWFFCDNEQSANNLAELVKNGIKKATTSLYFMYEVDNEAIPEEGSYDIITDWEGIAKCIIKNTSVDVIPFKEVTEEYAAIEGEGDKSLDYWRDVHINFFTKELREVNEDFSEDMLVVCEEFEVVYK